MAGPVAADDPASPEGIHRAKMALRRPGPVPSNVAFVAGLPPEERARYAGRVRRKPTRTLSGVAVVAVMTAPARCPHGRCAYCPGGIELRTPQSYTGEEPSALRGARFGWDPRAITAHRIATLEAIGHPTSKVEAIVMGGTFTARPWAYQRSVLHGIFEGANGAAAASLADAHAANETADHRIVSLTVETRPDWCDAATVARLLAAGVTRVELGVECLRDGVLRGVDRAHDVDAVRRATRLLRDFGLKVGYHMMPGLPGMTPERDREDLARLFDDPAFRPDMIKLYPTLVLPATPLFDAWRAGRYAPYDLPTAVALLADAKARFPGWVRVQRIQRDIPARLIAAGVRRGDLREAVRARLVERGARCRCLRCREPGRSAAPPPEAFRLTETSYEAAGGVERFLAFEDPDGRCVAGFLRLRLAREPPPGAPDGPIVRELKVLGTELPVGQRPAGALAYQHRGFGRSLLERAAAIARDAGHRRLFVTSAVGSRPYYRRLGFEPAGAHLAKPLFP